jgi:hypothetical protein
MKRWYGTIKDVVDKEPVLEGGKQAKSFDLPTKLRCQPPKV